MRYQHLKLTKSHSTSAERKFAEYCKELHIPFRTKVKVNGREVDFVIGRFAIEIDGHPQQVSKNVEILKKGLTPVHLHNSQITPALKTWLKKLLIYGR